MVRRELRGYLICPSALKSINSRCVSPDRCSFKVFSQISSDGVITAPDRLLGIMQCSKKGLFGFGGLFLPNVFLVIETHCF